MTPYITPETMIVPLTEENPILSASLDIDGWTNDDDSIDF